ncbi:hypothetical protein ZOSMA_315G00090 [Zostera marina]|uniref:Uncharacterized protein n=1 Tax=Zostera marina TaxID=29655 RepID=A0A0K9PBM7_ZOSMR|nr:hypothetical protein ZOSMA_315G00090 [Zostera marina]
MYMKYPNPNLNPNDAFFYIGIKHAHSNSLSLAASDKIPEIILSLGLDHLLATPPPFRQFSSTLQYSNPLANVSTNQRSTPLSQILRLPREHPLGIEKETEFAQPSMTYASDVHRHNRLKADIIMFYGLTNNDTFVDWMEDVENYLDFCEKS